MAVRSASGATGSLRGFLPRSPGQTGSERVWRLAEVGLALVNRRQRTLGPSHRLWRIPNLWCLSRWSRSTDLYPRGVGSGRVVGSVWLVEGSDYGRRYFVAPTHGAFLW